MAKIIETKIAYRGRGTVAIATIQIDGHTLAREVEDHGNAACVLPYDAARKTAILVRQFRAPVFLAAGAESFVEAIAGVVEESDHAETARREALEEAGLRLEKLEFVGNLWASPGVSTERMALYLAPYEASDRVGAGGGLADQHENTEAFEMPLARLASTVDEGGIADLKTFALVQSLRLRRPDLFRP